MVVVVVLGAGERATFPFKRLVLRGVLNDVSPIVARVFSIADDVEITDLHDIFLSMLGWQHDLGFIIQGRRLIEGCAPGCRVAQPRDGSPTFARYRHKDGAGAG